MGELLIAEEPETLQRALLELEVQRFLFAEAQLLDERRFDEWLALMAFDIVYRAPVRVTREGGEDIAGPGELHHFDDDYGQLELRVQALQVRSAWAEIPPSRTRRLITNVRVEPLEGSDVRAHSNFLLHRSRAETVEHRFVGQRRDVLRRLAPDDWRIVERTIVFDTVAFETDNISVLF